MHKLVFAALGLSLLVAAGPVSARGLGEAAEAEAARANSRAGGPTHYRDAELLIRYGGCAPTARSAFCRDLERKQRYHGRQHRPDW